MPGMPKIVHVEPESELGRLLDTAAESDILLEINGDRFRLDHLDAPAQLSSARDRGQLAPERILNIIGLGASAHGSDVARLKDAYVADAADWRE